jgi:hypothetical protein
VQQPLSARESHLHAAAEEGLVQESMVLLV